MIKRISSVKKISTVKKIETTIQITALDKEGGFKFWFNIKKGDSILEKAVDGAKCFNHSSKYPHLRDNNRIFYVGIDKTIFNLKSQRCFPSMEAAKKISLHKRRIK